MPVSDYDPIFEAAGREWNVDPTLLRAIAQQESAGNPAAVSRAGAQGLMQIMPPTQRGLGVEVPHDPAQSIFGAAKYMSQLMDRYKRPDLALAAYNAGPERVDAALAGRGSLPAETQAYVPSVAGHYQRFAADAGPYVIGDSIAQGLQKEGGFRGNATVGAKPGDVLAKIQGLPDGALAGRNVILSSGVSNDPSKTDLVSDQIQALRAKGAAGITLMGVGDRQDLAPLNDRLALVAGQSGAQFSGGLDPAGLAKDRVHPTQYKGLLASVVPMAMAAPAAASGTEDDDAFLKRTSGTTAPSASGESDDDFLKRTSGGMATVDVHAKLPAPNAESPLPSRLTSASTPPAQATPSPEDPYAAMTQPPAPGAPINRIAQAAKQGVVEGYNATPPVLTPAAEAAVNATGPVGQYVVNPALKALGGAAGVGAGLGLGAAGAIAQGATELGAPGLGRDINMALQVAPAAGADLTLAMPRGVPQAPPSPRFVQEYYGEGLPGNPLASPGEVALANVRRNPLATMVPSPSFIPPGATIPTDIAEHAAPSFIPPHSFTTPEGETVPVKMPATVPGAALQAEKPVAARNALNSIIPPEEPLPSTPPTTSVAAKRVANAYYKQADAVGGTLTPDFVNRFLDEAQKLAPQTEEGKAVTGDSTLTSLMGRLEYLRDKPVSLKAVQEIDEAIGNDISKEYGPRGLSKEGYNLQELQGTLRDMIRNAGPDDTTSGIVGFDALNKARLAYSQGMKMADLERIRARADLTDNPATSFKSGVRTLLTNQKMVRGYSPEEIAALQHAGDRGVIGSALHVFGGRIVPPMLGMIEAGGGGGLTGGLLTASAAHVAASAMRNLAAGIQARRLNNALSVLGSRVPPPPAP